MPVSPKKRCLEPCNHQPDHQPHGAAKRHKAAAAATTVHAQHAAYACIQQHGGAHANGSCEERQLEAAAAARAMRKRGAAERESHAAGEDLRRHHADMVSGTFK